MLPRKGAAVIKNKQFKRRGTNAKTDQKDACERSTEELRDKQEPHDGRDSL
jgi:hypothetical protein